VPAGKSNTKNKKNDTERKNCKRNFLFVVLYRQIAVSPLGSPSACIIKRAIRQPFQCEGVKSCMDSTHDQVSVRHFGIEFALNYCSGCRSIIKQPCNRREKAVEIGRFDEKFVGSGGKYTTRWQTEQGLDMDKEIDALQGEIQAIWDKAG